MSDQDDFELEAEEAPPSQNDDLARKEGVYFGRNPKPNSVHIALWKGGYLAFNPSSHVPVFALLALIVLCVLCVLISVVGIWLPGDAIWMDRLFTALGHAIAAIIGAMVGAAINNKKSD